jgi:hypothetical protein
MPENIQHQPEDEHQFGLKHSRVGLFSMLDLLQRRPVQSARCNCQAI